MPTPSLDALVSALVQARADGPAADAEGLAGSLPDAETAYAVQRACGEALGWFGGDAPPHWKSGGPGRDSVLTHAPLPTAGVWRSPAEASRWPFRLRGIEAEIALRLARPVDREQAAALTPETAAQLVDAMTVAIEIVDSRWAQGLDAPALCKLADLQSHGALVLGDWLPYAPRDWSQQICRVQIGTQPEVVRRGSHSLGDPAWLLPQWLRHATREGQTLPAGSVVTTGTWVGILEARAGDLVTARFDGIGEAGVQL
ncbi:fumarylacetoacetate hydrolase family protein [Ramlibacter sp. 2FC]|uniref:fumarylacetoacetate hydrolase family protein n=1 Tax=Ramlibacter sp. 2FC TaxID=2502188 RepID=UPI0010F9FA6B|nr:fumarylacetoacetate hydrolase family protein [Ramlibacter sp. 2FC]